MTTENTAAPGAAVEAPAPDVVETPEVTNPETATETPEQTDPVKALEERLEKERKKFERRLNAKHAQAAQALERARHLEQQLQERTAQPQDEPKQFDPRDIDRIATERAEAIARAREVDRRGSEITAQLKKALGGMDEVTALVEVLTEEAGPLIDPRSRGWTPLGEAVSEAEDPAALLIYLRENEDIAASLRGLTPAQLGRKVALIEKEMGTKKAEPKPSNAPKPLAPVKSAAKSTGEPDIKDTAAWIRWKNQQERRN